MFSTPVNQKMICALVLCFSDGLESQIKKEMTELAQILLDRIWALPLERLEDAVVAEVKSLFKFLRHTLGFKDFSTFAAAQADHISPPRKASKCSDKFTVAPSHWLIDWVAEIFIVWTVSLIDWLVCVYIQEFFWLACWCFQVPKPKALTKWEKYAKEKGIAKTKQSRMVWDQTSREWKPRWGYKKAATEDDDWVTEVPKDSGTLYFLSHFFYQIAVLL